jgi:hypothetical protein
MKTTLGLVAALLVAVTAYGQTAHARSAAPPQQPGMTTQTQPSGATSQTQTRQTPKAPSVGMTGGQAAVQAAPGQLPNGSYQTSCKDVRIDGQTLIGFCQKPDGTWQTSALKASQCAGDIQNVNGRLTCGAGTGYGASSPPASATTRSTPSTPVQRGY